MSGQRIKSIGAETFAIKHLCQKLQAPSTPDPRGSNYTLDSLTLKPYTCPLAAEASATPDSKVAKPAGKAAKVAGALSKM